MKKGIVYVVTAHRWGETAEHNYLLGVFTRKAQAIKAADEREDYQGYKYMCQVIEVPVDRVCDHEHVIIRHLKKSPCMEPQ